jgi:hypothetical protein
MNRCWILAAVLAMLACVCGPTRADDDDDDKPTAKTALQALNDFIGDWKGSGEPEGPTVDRRDVWSEDISWSWRFKGDDAWLVMKIKKGRYWKGGQLRYLEKSQKYQLKAVDLDGKEQVFEGRLKDGVLTLERVDRATKVTQRIKMNSAGDGARFVYAYEHKPRGRTIFYKDYRVGCTKEGESLGAAAKKVECVVTGGLGKIPVTYKGETYYVCCTGCRDAFNMNPEKYLKEFEARKKK